MTQQQLLSELNRFRYILQNFDYSDIYNVTFINLESLYCYIENVEDNPFKIQYDNLQTILDNIEMYIPFVTDDGFIDTVETDSLKYPYTGGFQKAFSAKKRLNFTTLVRTITDDIQWELILDICMSIRDRYEFQSYIHI